MEPLTPMPSDSETPIFSDFTRFKRHPQAVFSELDGEITLFQSRTCDYLVLNESGSAIWELLSQERTLNDLCRSLRHNYRVDPDVCWQEVHDWLVQAHVRQVVTALNPA